MRARRPCASRWRWEMPADARMHGAYATAAVAHLPQLVRASASTFMVRDIHIWYICPLF